MIDQSSGSCHCQGGRQRWCGGQVDKLPQPSCNSFQSRIFAGLIQVTFPHFFSVLSTPCARSSEQCLRLCAQLTVRDDDCPARVSTRAGGSRTHRSLFRQVPSYPACSPGAASSSHTRGPLILSPSLPPHHLRSLPSDAQDRLATQCCRRAAVAAVVAAAVPAAA